MAPRILPILSQLDDIAESIAEPPARRPFAKAVGEAGRRICDRRSANPGAAGYGGALGAAVDTMCGPYWEEQEYSPPSDVPPFSGGQCDGVRYSWNASYTTVDGTFNVNGDNVLGPVTTGPVIVPAPPTNKRLQFVARSASSSQFVTWFSVEVNQDALLTLNSFNVFPWNGSPDTCGDPDPVPTPGTNPAPDPGPIPPDEDVYDDPETGPMLPIPGLPGIPFRNPFGGRGSGDPPGDPGEPGDSVPADGIGGGAGAADAEGTAPPGSELVGLRLDLVSVLPNFPEYGDGIYRGGAYIYMGKVSGLDQDFGGSQIRDGQFFYAETPGQTKWRVTANVGISWLVTPFYREVN